MIRLSLLTLIVACAPVPAKVFYNDEAAEEPTFEPEEGPPETPPGDDDDSDDGSSDGDDDDGPDDPPIDTPPEDDIPDEDEEPPPDEEGLAEWTVMVYLAADNNLEGAALTDLNEMEVVGSSDAVNILVEIDRAHGHSREDGDWTGARRYRVEADDDTAHITSPIAVDLGEVDSGAPSTFIDFIAWGVEHHPAKRYAFVIWNHGWGWTLAPSRKGIASDDHSGSELTVAGGEYEAILQAATDITGAPIALLGMDACLMASWEVARVGADYGDIFVASQATESWDGWAFDTAFSDLKADPEMEAGELGTIIAQRFHETEDATLSVIDLAQLRAMDGALDAFSNAVMADDDPRDEIRRQARRSQGFDGDPDDKDLGDFMSRMAEASDNPDIVSAAEDVSAELSEVIVSNFTYGEWVSDATGLSIYLTLDGPNSAYLAGSWNDLTQWDEMLDAIDN